MKKLKADLNALVASIKELDGEYQKLKKQVISAQKQYGEASEKYKAVKASREEERLAIEKELAALANGADAVAFYMSANAGEALKPMSKVASGGELARIMARTYGEQSFKESDKHRDLGDEMADVLWVLICLANQTGVNLTEAFQRNLEKKTNRDKDRHKNNPKL